MLEERYFIERVVGEGGMGTVYRAQAADGEHRSVAVKIMHPRLRSNTIQRMRFEREAELASRLRHKNLVQVFDRGVMPDGSQYVVMELVEGRDLAQLRRETPMSAPRVLRLMQQICDGLEHAHEHGVIHRDLKHQNVIVARDPQGREIARIVDFGVALVQRSRARRLTPALHTVGSPYGMAPEAAVGQPIDHRVDLFALGVISYQLLCGVMPFEGTGHEVVHQNLAAPTPWMAERAPGVAVDPLLELWTRRLLSKRPEGRFASARAAREMLDLIWDDRLAAQAALVRPAIMPKATEQRRPLVRPAADDPDDVT